MNYTLPKRLDIHGAEYAIRWDFRAALDICAALSDPELDDRERALAALMIFYPELERMRTLVAAVLRMRDAHITIHDFRMVPGDAHTNLIFDVALPLSLQGQEQNIREALEEALNHLCDKTYHPVITFDPTPNL